jgi:hypothetical protein
MHYEKLLNKDPKKYIKMEGGNIEKLARIVMVDGKLEITDPLFTDNIINQVSVEYNKHKNRKQILISILVFIGIEFILFASVDASDLLSGI